VRPRAIELLIRRRRQYHGLVNGRQSRMQKVRAGIRVDLSSAAVEMVRLRERHDELERRLAELERHLSLTPDEQMERSQIKKEKLRTKDELTRLGALRAP
jgi:uncharacterized protein YdcH (DUF465 family)